MTTTIPATIPRFTSTRRRGCSGPQQGRIAPNDIDAHGHAICPACFGTYKVCKNGFLRAHLEQSPPPEPRHRCTGSTKLPKAFSQPRKAICKDCGQEWYLRQDGRLPVHNAPDRLVGALLHSLRTKPAKLAS